MKKVFIFSKTDKSFSLMEQSRYNPIFDGIEISRHIYENTVPLEKHLKRLIKKYEKQTDIKGLRVI